MKKILGLDLGTNSIGWALIDGENHKIVKIGSRIIPMDAQAMSDFKKGNLKSSASVRTGFRGTRRLYQRAELRRERLLRVLNKLNFLPEHFKNEIDFEKHPGKFKDHSEPLLPYCKSSSGKHEFIFMDSFNEMLSDFKKSHPELVADGKKIPYDWVIYYLRKKALSTAVKREELAWIILNFNAKRGYYQLRGDELDTVSEKNEEYMVLEVVKVEKMDPDKKRRGYDWYLITYENGATQRKLGKIAPRNVGDKVEVIVTTTYDKNGNVALDKDGCPKIKLRSPKEDDWALMKKRTEHDLEQSRQSVGAYVYSWLLVNPAVKVKGKLIRTIERKYYKEELISILNKQKEFIPELNDHSMYIDCVRELYRNNEAHVDSLSNGDFTRLFVDDIIFYQRPLKSKKNTIADCPHEQYHYVNKESGEIVNIPIKVISKSHPLYQEFRLWHFIRDLKIYQREGNINGKLKTDVDVTADYIKDEKDVEALFEFLNELNEVSNDMLLKHFGLSSKSHRWNYVESKIYPCNETRWSINRDGYLDSCKEIALWHILYSVDDPVLLRKALRTFAVNNNIDNAEKFVGKYIHTKPFESDYGRYSEKALKKMLPLMRTGTKWRAEAIDEHTLYRIRQIIDGKDEPYIYESAEKNGFSLKSVNDFKALPLWFAEYVVYGKRDEYIVWKSPEDIDYYLKFCFKQHSLRNPVVEAILGETLRVVRDIWFTYGKIDEVHVELGRDLKQSADKRKGDTERILENERTNQRIRTLLQEFVNPDCGIENVRPYSPSQLELLKIYEADILCNEDVPEELVDVFNNLGNATKHVAHNDVMRYKLWLEQKYRSPYTGDVIPLSKLFTTAYEIEHIIPQSRYFDDSLSNKVICESEINKLKDNSLAYEFIQNKHGQIIGGHKVFDQQQYEDFIKQHYANNRSKMRKLLMEDIPADFINRQLNDSRYIARKTIEILSNIVRQTTADGKVADNDKGDVSINVIASNGAITDRLKKEWGITQVWSHIITPRFERLNQITGTIDFGQWMNVGGKRYFQINIPIELSAGFSKKRIDHRHHAMDAVVIACSTRDHINYLNNSAAAASEKKLRYDLQHKLCFKDKTDGNGNYVWRFNKPWDTFTQDVEAELQRVIVSFKQNLRVINKMTNYSWHYENGRKVLSKQLRGDGWAVRKSLHKASVSGAVRVQRIIKMSLKEALKNWHQIKDKNIRKAIKALIIEYKKFDETVILRYFKDRKYILNGKDISKVEVYVLPLEADLSARRWELDISFDERKIASVSDSGIRSILLNYLKEHDNDPKIAFTPEGIMDMNNNIRKYNGGKDHKPILKVRKTEALGLKFPVGECGNKKSKYVEADKGTNLFFAVYTDKEGERSYTSIPFNEAVECMKKRLPVAPEYDENGNELLFVLSPGDLVYVPSTDGNVDSFQTDRIYKLVSSTGKSGFFVPCNIAAPIIDTIELGANNKAEKSWTGEMIKNVCVRLKVSRLGIVTKYD